MSRASIIVIITLLLIPTMIGSGTGTDWPMFRADSANTGSNDAIPPRAGTVIWTYGTGESIGSSPAVVDRNLFIGDMSGMVWSLDALTGKFRWNKQTTESIESSPTVVEGTVYIGSNDDSLHALDVSDGSVEWSFPTGGDIRSSASVARQGNDTSSTVLVFGSYDNRVYAVDTSGNKVWDFSASSYIHGKPAISDGLAFTCSCDRTVYGIDVATGARVWNVSIDDYSGISPAADNGTLFAAGRSGKVFSIDISTGVVDWELEVKGLIEASPAVGDGLVFVGTRDGEMNAIDIVTGERSWLYRANRQIMSSPALVDGILFFGDDEGILHALQASDGKELWNFTADGAIQSSPAVAYGMVFFATDKGTVYALGDTRPSIRIRSPVAWERVKGKVMVDVEAYGTDLASVEVSLAGKRWVPAMYRHETGTWSVTVDTRKSGNGEKELMAKATNATGDATTSIYVVVKNPEVDKPYTFIPGAHALAVVMAVSVAFLVLRGRHGR